MGRRKGRKRKLSKSISPKKKPKDEFPLAALPTEVLIHLMIKLKPAELYNLRSTCRHLYEIGLHSSIWKNREVLIYNLNDWDKSKWDTLRRLNVASLSVEKIQVSEMDSSHIRVSVESFNKVLESCPRLKSLSIEMKHARCFLRAAHCQQNNIEVLYVHQAYRSRHFIRQINYLTNLRALYLYDVCPKLLRNSFRQSLTSLNIEEFGIELFCSYRKVQHALQDIRCIIYSLHKLKRFAIFCTNDEHTYYSLFKRPSRWMLSEKPQLLPRLHLHEFNLKWLDGACPAPDTRFWHSISSITSLQLNVDCSPSSDEIHDVLDAAKDELPNLIKLRIGIYFQGHACCLPYIPNKLTSLEIENLCGKDLEVSLYRDVIDHIPEGLEKTLVDLTLYEIPLDEESIGLAKERFPKMQSFLHSSDKYRCERKRLPAHRHL